MGVATLEKRMPMPPKPRLMSEEEFEAWGDEDVKAEFVDGEVIVIAPESVGQCFNETEFGTLLNLFVKKNELGFVMSTGNLPVRLRKGLRRCPDVMFIQKSRANIIRKTHIEGAPDFALEFVSPDSVIRDWHEKYVGYETAGVREYWIVDLTQQRMAAYALGGDRRYQIIAPQDGKVLSRVLPGFWFKAEWFWQEPSFDVYAVAKEIGLLA